MWITKPLIRLYIYTSWSAPLLLANKFRFSHAEAHMVTLTLQKYMVNDIMYGYCYYGYCYIFFSLNSATLSIIHDTVIEHMCFVLIGWNSAEFSCTRNMQQLARFPLGSTWYGTVSSTLSRCPGFGSLLRILPPPDLTTSTRSSLVGMENSKLPWK